MYTVLPTTQARWHGITHTMARVYAKDLGRGINRRREFGPRPHYFTNLDDIGPEEAALRDTLAGGDWLPSITTRGASVSCKVLPRKYSASCQYRGGSAAIPCLILTNFEDGKRYTTHVRPDAAGIGCIHHCNDFSKVARICLALLGVTSALECLAIQALTQVAFATII